MSFARASLRRVVLTAMLTGLGGVSSVDVAAAAPAGADLTRRTFRLHNALADDQESERIALFLDDTRVGELRVDRKSPEATLTFELSRPVHRYRLEGETRFEGTTYRIDGGGLIVTAERMDELAESSPTAVEAVARYRALVAELQAAAPEADLSWVTFVPSPKAEAAAIAAAEKRLGIPLPEGYRRLVTEVGGFALGSTSSPAGAVLVPEKLATAVDFHVATVRENGWDDPQELRELTARIAKRYPQSRRDVVLDFFELGEPTILVAAHRCRGTQSALAFPAEDFDLLGLEAGDNPFLGLIGYQDIMGEPECYDYDRMLAYRLHDHLLEMADEALFVRNAKTDVMSFYRARTDDGTRRIWMRLTEADE